jgi:putative transposase
MASELPQRKRLHHDVPSWVNLNDSVFFITVCCQTRGNNQLCNEVISQQLLDTVQRRVDQRIWYPHVFLLMPDHVHALFSFPAYSREGMTKVMRLWKAWTAKQVGIRWQRGFFDHRLRNDKNHRQKADYILQNPVRAGLVTNAEDWPFVWFPNRPTQRVGPTQDVRLISPPW